jgi:AbrB family looped-hinge helix DNA binding protein
MEMRDTATVTSRSMINIPARIRAKYKIKEGSKVVFVETEHGLVLVPVPPINDLFGIDKERKELWYEAIRELNEEHRREAAND